MTVGQLELITDGDSVFVRLNGEIDLSNAAAISEEILEGCGMQRVVVDLSGVTYLDSTGVRMIFEIASRCSADDQPLTLVVPEGSPLVRILRITQVQHVARLVTDLDEVSPA